jgi:hypothetical protein
MRSFIVCALQIYYCGEQTKGDEVGVTLNTNEVKMHTKFYLLNLKEKHNLNDKLQIGTCSLFLGVGAKAIHTRVRK